MKINEAADWAALIFMLLSGLGLLILIGKLIIFL